MMLRKFRTHIHRQDWFAVVLDVLVVVVGIIIGLQATEWNQARLDRLEEMKYLRALDTDLETSHIQLVESMERYNLIRQALIRLAELGDNPSNWPVSENFDELIWQGLWDLAFLEEHMNVYKDLESSGRMNLIDDQELRRGLSDLNSMYERFGKTEHDVLQVQNLHIDGYLADQFAIRNFSPYTPNGDGLPKGPEPSPPDYLAFLTAQPTQSRIAMKYISATSAKSGLLSIETKLLEVQQSLRDRMSALAL